MFFVGRVKIKRDEKKVYKRHIYDIKRRSKLLDENIPRETSKVTQGS